MTDLNNLNSVINSLKHLENYDFPKNKEIKKIVDELKDIKKSYEGTFKGKVFHNTEYKQDFLKLDSFYTKNNDVYISGVIVRRDKNDWSDSKNTSYTISFVSNHRYCTIKDWQEKIIELEFSEDMVNNTLIYTNTYKSILNEINNINIE